MNVGELFFCTWAIAAMVFLIYLKIQSNKGDNPFQE